MIEKHLTVSFKKKINKVTLKLNIIFKNIISCRNIACNIYNSFLLRVYDSCLGLGVCFLSGCKRFEVRFPDHANFFHIKADMIYFPSPLIGNFSTYFTECPQDCEKRYCLVQKDISNLTSEVKQQCQKHYIMS